MVRHYIRKKQKTYSDSVLEQAVEDVRNGLMTCSVAATVHGVPRTTINTRLLLDRQYQNNTAGRPTVFSAATEKKMAENLHIMEKHGFPLTRKEARILIAEYVRINKIETPFKNDVPGKDWFLGFQKRNGMSIKKPQNVEMKRRKAVDPFIVHGYIDLLEKVVEDLNIKDKPHRIYNLDETSICNDPVKGKVMGKKGFRSTRTTSGPGRNNTTVLLASNACGDKVPPLIIFQGMYLWSEWLYPDQNVETAYAVSKKGWMETSIFEQYMRKTFVPALGDERPVLVILDGHSTHVDLNVIEYAASQDITVLKLPPHSSHILQPLDCSTMKPLKDNWEDEIIKWQRLHVGAKLQKSEFAKMLTKIWNDMDATILQNGFRKAGAYPINREAIPKEEYDSLLWKKWVEFKRQQAELVQMAPGDSVKTDCEAIENTVPSLLSLAIKKINDHLLTEINNNYIIEESYSKNIFQTSQGQKMDEEMLEVQDLSEEVRSSLKVTSKRAPKMQLKQKQQKSEEFQYLPNIKKTKNVKSEEVKNFMLVNKEKTQTLKMDEEMMEIRELSEEVSSGVEVTSKVSPKMQLKQKQEKSEEFQYLPIIKETKNVKSEQTKDFMVVNKEKTQTLKTYKGKINQKSNKIKQDLLHQNNEKKLRNTSQGVVVKTPSAFKLNIPKRMDTSKLSTSTITILDTRTIAIPETAPDDHVSFETLLLKKIARNDPNVNRKKRVTNSNNKAEVLTYKHVMEQMKKEKEEKDIIIQNKLKRKMAMEQKKQEKTQKKRQKTVKKKKQPKKTLQKIKQKHKIDVDSDSTGSYQSRDSSDSEDVNSFFESILQNQLDADEQMDVCDDVNDDVKTITEKKKQPSKERIPLISNAPKAGSSKQESISSQELISYPEKGKFILGKFSSSKGKKTYKYVCQIDELYNEQLVVLGFKSKDKQKHIFRAVEGDCSIIDTADIVTYLPDPLIQGNNYIFPCKVEVFEL